MAPSATEPQTTSELTHHGVSKALKSLARPLSKYTDSPLLSKLDASKLETTTNANLRAIPAPGSALASRCPTDHMINCAWSAQTGWSTPQLLPYGPLALMPTASCLHYATECFEGMKLYRGFDRKLRIFRPNCNTERMLMSATRVALPAFDPAEIEKLIIALCARDGTRWLPVDRPGDFLYIRPTLIGTDEDLGVKAPNSALFFILLTNMPSLSDITASRPVPGLRLLASTDDECRAWPGGFGSAKLGANYGPSLVAQKEAAGRGYDQILWLFGPQGRVTEAGASNFFVVWRTPSGSLEMVTAPLGDKMILDGVTRRSVIQLAKERLGDELEVVERDFVMDEVKRAAQEGRLVEAFSAGTAYFVSAVSAVCYKGEDVHVPLAEGTTGAYAKLLKGWLGDIMYGREQHPWGVVIPEQGN